MKTKLPKSFVLLILSIAFATGLLVSAQANGDASVSNHTSVPSHTSVTNPNHSDEYTVTDSETESSSNDIYTPDFEADYANLTLYELFDLLEYSLGLDENETVENGGDVAAVMSVAEAVKSNLNYAKVSGDYISLLTSLDEAFAYNGVNPSERTARIIEEIKNRIRDMYAEEPATTQPAADESACRLSEICDCIKNFFSPVIELIINIFSIMC